MCSSMLNVAEREEALPDSTHPNAALVLPPFQMRPRFAAAQCAGSPAPTSNPPPKQARIVSLRYHRY